MKTRVHHFASNFFHGKKSRVWCRVSYISSLCKLILPPSHNIRCLYKLKWLAKTSYIVGQREYFLMPRKYYRLLTRVHISFFSCFHQSVVNDSSFSVLLLKCYLSHQSFQQIALFSIHARCLKLTTKLIEVRS